MYQKDCRIINIYARLVFHYLDNTQLKNSLSEVYRLLKRNGRSFIVVRSVEEWEVKLEETTYDSKTGLTTSPDIKP